MRGNFVCGIAHSIWFHLKYLPVILISTVHFAAGIHLSHFLEGYLRDKKHVEAKKKDKMATTVYTGQASKQAASKTNSESLWSALTNAQNNHKSGLPAPATISAGSAPRATQFCRIPSSKQALRVWRVCVLCSKG